MGGRCLELMVSGGCLLNVRIVITEILFKRLVFLKIKGGYMDRSKVKDWAPGVACDIQGLARFDAYKVLHKLGFRSSESWEVVAAHLLGDGFVAGTVGEISKTIISVVGTSVRVAGRVFDEHCKCKRLDANGKCDAFCFHNRLKSRGVMVDCIGIETSPVVISGHIAGSTRL
jgi:hypothetical protein